MKVLVVDDDKRIVKTTCDILRLKGFEALGAYSGEEGVERVTADKPDCVLMDINMPGIGGVAALKQMRQIAPNLPVVLVSAYAADELLDEAKRVGAYAILSKPLDLPLILSFLALLQKHESILVVDEDKAVCESLRAELARNGYEVETESDAKTVLRHLDENYKLVVVLLDVALDVANKGAVLADICAKYPGKPVVLMSAHSGAGIGQQQAHAMGAYSCLEKPLDTVGLLKMIEEIRLDKLRNMLGTP